MSREPRCTWIERDADGRPRCEHGWAFRSGSRWYCAMKRRATLRRYRATAKGKAMRQRENASAAARSSKQLYDLTRVRAR